MDQLPAQLKQAPRLEISSDVEQMHVQGAIGIHDPPHVAGPRSPFVGEPERVDRLQLVDGHALDAAPDRQYLQLGAYLIEILEELAVYAPNRRAAVGLDLHQTFAFELAQGFAHRHRAQAEALGQIRQFDALARPVLTGDDRLANEQARLVDRCLARLAVGLASGAGRGVDVAHATVLRGRWRSRHQQARVLGFGDHRAVLVHQFDRFDHDAAARRLALALADEAHADTHAVARIDRGTEADLVPAKRAERGGLVELQLGLQAFDQG